MSEFGQFKNIYFEECSDLITHAEETLLSMQAGDVSLERINALFRAIHSIKGGAGSFGFNNIVTFAHEFETLLDHLRNESIIFTPDICQLLIRANDVLQDLINLAKADSDEKPLQFFNVHAQLLEILEHHTGKSKTAKQVEIEEEAETTFKIVFKPNPNMMQFGNDPLFLIRELGSLKLDQKSENFSVVMNTDEVPLFYEMDWSLCYCWWQFQIKTIHSAARIREVFEFVEDDCELIIEVLEKNVKNQTLSDESIKFQNNKPQEMIILKNDMVDSAKNQKDEISHSIRVELDRIDRLVNTVGEMVIKQAMLIDQAQLIQGEGIHDFIKGLQDLNHHMRDLQDYVMAIRAQPVKTVFSRIPRLVREVASELGKEVNLVMSGESTEIDKTVIERLGEPLMHMIRNAVDHGIECPDEREKNKKNRAGSIHLHAEHKSGRILIEITDDGKGINRNGILKKALERDLIPVDHNLSGDEIDNLIFLPGFSTATEVTNISGRGVGMDVVKKSIQALGGRVSITSTEGKGCKFTLTLPLTLAVLDGMIASVGGQQYIIPIINIIETLRPSKSQVSSLIGCHDIMLLRKNTISLVYLHEIFNIPNAIHEPWNAIVVVVESEGGELIGLVVDELHKQQQVVIKGLEDNYDPIPGISAATILGNGNVSMILDVAVLKKLGQQQYKKGSIAEKITPSLR